MIVIKFELKYFVLTITIFIIELIIALFVHDNFVRSYFGDVLVVILIYCFIKSFFKLKVLIASTIVLVFAFTIEFLQYMNIVEKLELQNSKIASTVIGTTFSWLDILTYVIGILIVLVFEYNRKSYTRIITSL